MSYLEEEEVYEKEGDCQGSSYGVQLSEVIILEQLELSRMCQGRVSLGCQLSLIPWKMRSEIVPSGCMF